MSLNCSVLRFATCASRRVTLLINLFALPQRVPPPVPRGRGRQLARFVRQGVCQGSFHAAAGRGRQIHDVSHTPYGGPSTAPPLSLYHNHPIITPRRPRPAPDARARRSLAGQVDSQQMSLNEIAGGLRSIQTVAAATPAAAARRSAAGDGPWGWLVPGEWIV
jgi:hypothetical protein